MKSFFDKIRDRFKEYEHPVGEITFDAIANSLDQVKNAPIKPKWHWGSFKSILFLVSSGLSLAIVYSIYQYNTPASPKNDEAIINKKEPLKRIVHKLEDKTNLTSNDKNADQAIVLNKQQKERNLITLNTQKLVPDDNTSNFKNKDVDSQSAEKNRPSLMLVNAATFNHNNQYTSEITKKQNNNYQQFNSSIINQLIFSTQNITKGKINKLADSSVNRKDDNYVVRSAQHTKNDKISAHNQNNNQWLSNNSNDGNLLVVKEKVQSAQHTENDKINAHNQNNNQWLSNNSNDDNLLVVKEKESLKNSVSDNGQVNLSNPQIMKNDHVFSNNKNSLNPSEANIENLAPTTQNNTAKSNIATNNPVQNHKKDVVVSQNQKNNIINTHNPNEGLTERQKTDPKTSSKEFSSKEKQGNNDKIDYTANEDDTTYTNELISKKELEKSSASNSQKKQNNSVELSRNDPENFLQPTSLNHNVIEDMEKLTPLIIDNNSNFTALDQGNILQNNELLPGLLKRRKNYFNTNKFAASFEFGPSLTKTKMLSPSVSNTTQYKPERKNNLSWQLAGHLHYNITNEFEAYSGVEHLTLSSNLTYKYQTSKTLSDTIIIDTFKVVRDTLFQDSVIVITTDTVNVRDTTINYRDTLLSRSLSKINHAKYLSIPLNLSYSYRINRIRLWANAGIGLNFLLKGEEWVLEPSEAGEVDFINYPDKLKSFYFNINLGLGIAYQLTENLEVYTHLARRFNGNRRYEQENIFIKNETISNILFGVKYQF